MRSLKFIFPKTPFMSILTGMFVALFLIGCGQTGDRQTTVGPGAADNFSSPIPAPLEKLRTGLNAKVIVDGGTPRVQIVNLQVDTQNDRVVGTIPNLPVGRHTFEIQYFIDNALIATAPAITVNIQANVDTPVPFDAGALVYPDTDNDGFTNLNEVEIFGSASDAWTNPNLKPEVSVVVNPGTAILPPNGVQTFTAAIAQNANLGVTWSVEGGDANGTITPGGTYTAPATPGPYNVVATSQVDPSKRAIIPVTVVNPGILDLAFNTNGIVSTDLGTFSSVSGIAIQADGKIIAVGQADINLQSNTQFHFTLVRYNTDGSLDTSFGTGGIVKTILGTGSFPSSIAIQADGKIIVAGNSNVNLQSNTQSHFTLVRYNPADGSVDTSFGTGGIVKTILGTSSFPSSIAIQADGKIIAAGNSNVNLQTNTEFHFTLVRYNPADGSVDTSFGTGGIVKTILGTSSFPSSIAIQADGKIIAAGNSNVNLQSNTAFHFTLVRYNPADGSVDTSFGTGGIVKTILGTGSFPSAITIQADGKIIAAGNSNVNLQSNTQSHFTLVRYNPADGSVDTSFGTGGTVKTILGTNSSASSLSVQTDGKIIAAGNSNVNLQSNTEFHFTLVRYNPADGSVDASFGTGGIVKTILGTGSFPAALKLQGDGKIVAAGNSNLIINTESHFTLVRYQTAAPAVLLRANLTGSEEIPAVTTLATGSASFVISPNQTEITYTLHVADIGINGITAVQIHFGAPGAEGRALFTLTTSTFVSPLVGKLTAADLDRIAATEGINTFADAIKVMRDGNAYIHVHTSTHIGGEIRGQIIEAPPTLSQLQAEIFSQRCGAVCHRAGGFGGIETGLFLDTKENSFNLLVNVPSVGDPNVKRVEPGNPNASYLIQKLEGTVPGRMPADGPPFLADEEIKKVRDWISAGAKND